MGMPPNQLVGDRLDRIGDREVAGLVFELRDEDRLEQEVAELLAQRVVVLVVDRFEQLVRFLEHVLLQRVDRLLAVPRASTRCTQGRHDVDEAYELACGIGSE
jgi:hypothetical protein